MTHGSLFSGIGGFDLAAQWMNWKNIFHCEWDPFGQQVLKHHFPNSISYNDITKTDFSVHRGTIDILSGGFPCQPYSLAGKRKGKDDERHLWPEMLRAIREIQPSWVVGENVFGLINWNGGLVFNEVQTDLEAAGYEVFPYVLPACAVNAPHRRDRVWFVAKNTKRNGCLQREFIEERTEIRQQRNTCTRGVNWIHLSKGDAPNTNCNGQHGGNGQHEINTSEGRKYALNDIEQTTLHTNNKRLERGEDYGSITEIGENGDKQFARCISSAWQDFPTQSPICGGNDGLPTQLDGITFSKWRNESIKAYGNAIVPEVALQIFKAIEEFATTIQK